MEKHREQMTKHVKHESGGGFSDWLRQQSPLDSSKGYVVTDLDFFYYNYKTGKYILLEEKRMFGSNKKNELTYSQRKIFGILDQNCKSDPNYKGFFVITFENTCPSDGRIFVNGMEYTEGQLIKFLKLNW